MFLRGRKLKRLVKNVLLAIHQRSKAKKIFNFSMFHIASHFAFFKEFPILFNPEQTTITPLILGFFSKIKIPHKCNINTQNTHMNVIFANYLNL